MSEEITEFFHNFRQELLAGAEANKDFAVVEFAEKYAGELVDAGNIDGFDACHYRRPAGMRVDGYWFGEDGALDLFIVDFENRNSPSSLTQTEVNAIFNRLENFFEASVSKALYSDLEETSQGYGLARDISDRKGQFDRVNFYLLSERVLSDLLKALGDKKIDRWSASFHIWDLSRLHRMCSSLGAKEALDINFQEMFGQGVSCLPAHLSSGSFESYLVVLPAEMLSQLYGKYGTRLLEQNVRCFLQARGKVNKGIRATILNDPEMFFAYNNGLTATAQNVQTKVTDQGLVITSLTDLQIVNGGQTTASLFHTSRKDKASLSNVFVQMKLSVIDAEKSEDVVPKISEYANTQNRVLAADFFSNHPFHIRMEESSRRMWAPAQKGMQRETKWFYERARGQYLDAQSKLTDAQKRKFQAESPRTQMFTKTDLAKFENVWDEKPRFVNLGAQKNFAEYAKRIGREWKKTPDNFNEFYFKRAVARAIIFRRTEKLVSAQPWYSGGYRANIVAYTLAIIAEYCKGSNQALNFIKIWADQEISPPLEEVLKIVGKAVHDNIMEPSEGISNISEWCKKDACWTGLQNLLPKIKKQLPKSFCDELISADDMREETKTARSVQKIDSGIEAQIIVMNKSGPEWRRLMTEGLKVGALTEKEAGVMRFAAQIPNKIPTEKQSLVLIEALEKLQMEGIS